MRLLGTCYHWRSQACVRLVQVEETRQTTAQLYTVDVVVTILLRSDKEN